MATVTSRGGVHNTTAGAKATGSFTPAAGSLLVAVVNVAGTDTAPTMSDSLGGAWTLVDSFRSYGSAITGGLRIYCRNSAVTASSMTVTVTPTGDAGGGILVFEVTDPSAFGASAVRSTGGQADQAAGTPAPVLSNTPRLSNPIIAACMTQTNGSANNAIRAGYTEDTDAGYNTPATGWEIQHRSSGETSATITLGAATPSGFAAIAIEVSTNIAVTLTPVTETDSARDGAYPDATAEFVVSGAGANGDLSASPVCPSADVRVGDILLLIYESVRGSPKHTPVITGGAEGTWTTLADGEVGTGATDPRGAVYAKLAEATDIGATFNVTGPNNANTTLEEVYASIHVIRVGAPKSLAGALDPASVNYQNVTTPFTVAGFSTAFAAELITLALAKGSNVGHDTYVATDPATLTERFDNGVAGLGYGNVLATASKSGTGATGSFDWNAAAGADAAVSIAGWVPIPFIDKTLGLTVVTEANSAIAQLVSKALGITTATETDSAIAQAFYKALTLTVVSESDSAIAQTFFKALSLTPVAETDTPIALVYELVAADIIKSLTLVSESSTAVGLTYYKELSLTPVGETSAATPETAYKTVDVTTAAETDSPQAITFYRSVTITPATETDSAQALVVTKPILKDIATIAETDSAIAQSAAKALGITLVSEADSAQALTHSKTISLTPVSEADAAQAQSASKAVDLTPATEADQAQALTFTKVIHIDLTAVVETDLPTPLTQAGQNALIFVTETNTVVPLSFTKDIVKTLTPVSEADTAQALAAFKELTAAAVVETDTAVPLSISIPIIRSLTPVAEVDSAVALSVGVVGQIDSAHDPTEGHATDGARGGRVRSPQGGHVF